MERFLDRLHDGWGGATGYFGVNGVDPRVIDEWRTLFITPG
jgi:hypothetical protein